MVASLAPDAIPDLYRWHRADDLVALYEDGASVSSWPSRVAGKSALAPASPAGTAPVFVLADGSNGQPGVQANSTSGTSLRGTMPSLPQEFTIGVVWRRTGSATGRGVWTMYTNSTATTNRGRLSMPTVTTLEARGNATQREAADNLAGLNTAAPQVSTVVNRLRNVEQWYQGGSDGPGADVEPGDPFTNSNSLSLFQAASASSNNAQIRIFEVAVWGRALTLQELAAYHRYCGERYQLPIQAPIAQYWDGADWQPTRPEYWDGTYWRVAQVGIST